MCGRYTLRTPAAQLIKIFNVSDISSLAPRYNIAPTQMVLTIRANADRPAVSESVFMKWGLIPFWAKDEKIGSKMINARSETVAEKPAFRVAVKQRRCLVVADGFIEWQTLSNKKKQPWLMELDDRLPFAFAGLWETWSPKDDSRAADVVSCTIITTEANEDMQKLHNRMPVILPIETWASWLNPESNPTQCLQLLKPLKNGMLTMTSISTMVNRPSPDKPECLSPVESPEPFSGTV